MVHDAINELFYLWPKLSENKMWVHFYTGDEEEFEELIPLKHEMSTYLDWHKDFFSVFPKYSIDYQ